MIYYGKTLSSSGPKLTAVQGYDWSKYPPGYRKSIEEDTKVQPELLNTPPIKPKKSK